MFKSKWSAKALLVLFGLAFTAGSLAFAQHDFMVDVVIANSQFGKPAGVALRRGGSWISFREMNFTARRNRRDATKDVRL